MAPIRAALVEVESVSGYLAGSMVAISGSLVVSVAIISICAITTLLGFGIGRPLTTVSTVSISTTVSTISTAVSTVSTVSTVGFSGGTCHDNSEYELKKDMVVTKLVFLLVTKILLNLKNCKDDYNSVQLF